MRVEDIIKKDEVTEMDYMYLCLEACATSCQFDRIILPERTMKYPLRANLNVFLKLPMGAGKTTSLMAIPNAVYTNRLTFPALVGTINKEGNWVEGELIRSAGKVLILDEFYNIPIEVKQVLNQVLDRRPYSRTLGFEVRNTVRKRGRFLKLTVKKNRIDLDVRLSCIASSTFLARDFTDSEQGTVSLAYSTRFLIINFRPSVEYYENLTKGETCFKINPKPEPKSFLFKDFLRAHSYYWENIKQKPYFRYFQIYSSEMGFLARLLLDWVRLSAFLTHLEGKRRISFDTFKLLFDKFIDFGVWNYLSTGMSERDYTILTLHKRGLTSSDIANYLRVSERTVDRRLSALRQMFLI
jgi:hypothetical protein